MKYFICLVVCFFSTGCFLIEQAAINSQADVETEELDKECRSEMTDWCLHRYSLIEEKRKNNLNDLGNRRRQAAEAWREAWKDDSVSCTSTQLGNSIHTTCR